MAAGGVVVFVGSGCDERSEPSRLPTEEPGAANAGPSLDIETPGAELDGSVVEPRVWVRATPREGVVAEFAVAEAFGVLRLPGPARWDAERWDRFDEVVVRYPADVALPVAALRSGGRVVGVRLPGVGAEAVGIEVRRMRSAEGLPDGAVGRVEVTVTGGYEGPVEVFEVAVGAGASGEDGGPSSITRDELAEVLGVESVGDGVGELASPGLVVSMADASRVSPTNRRGYLFDDSAAGWDAFVGSVRSRAAGGTVLLEGVSGRHFFNRDLHPPFAIGTGLPERAAKMVASLGTTNRVAVSWPGAWSPRTGFDEREPATFEGEAGLIEVLAAQVDPLARAGVSMIVVPGDGGGRSPGEIAAVLRALSERFPGVRFAVTGEAPAVVRRHADVFFEATRRPDLIAPDAARVEVGEGSYHALKSGDVVGATLTPPSVAYAVFRYGEVASVRGIRPSRARLRRDIDLLRKLGYVALFETDVRLPELRGGG